MPYERMVRSFQNPVIASTLFLLFERVRVDRCVIDAYPGVGRRMDALSLGLDVPPLRSEAPADTALYLVANALNGVAITGTDAASVTAMAVMDIVNQTPWRCVNDVVATVVATAPLIEELLQAADVSGEMAKGLGFSPESLSDDDKAVEAKAASLLRSLETETDFDAARDSVQSEDNDGLTFAEMSEFLD